MITTTFTQTTPAASGPYSGDYLWSNPDNWTNGVPVDGSNVDSSLNGFADISGLDLGTLTIPSGGAELDVVADLTIDDLILGSASPSIVANAGSGSPVTLDVAAVTLGDGVTSPAGFFGAEYPGAVLDITVGPDVGAFYYAFAGGMLEIHGTPSSDSTITYESPDSPAGTIALFDPAPIFTGLLGNVGVGTVLELPGTTVTDVTIGGGSLNVVTNSGTYDFAQATIGAGVTGYTAADDSSTGLVAITFDTAPCYAEGTRIMTIDGERPVETLREGALVVTTGGLARVRWVGHRAIDCRGHPRPAEVWPVRVRAGAFGELRPHRDLLLSPDHAVFEGGVLIPVRYLLNGATIAQEEVARVSYWHVELAEHAVIFAEGLTAESFLDTGNRGDFADTADGVARLDKVRPDKARVGEARAEAAMAVWESGAACADLVLGGPALVAAKTRLLARAEALGCGTTDEPALRLLCGGRALLPVRDGQVWAFDLPRRARDVRLVSRRRVPACMEPASDDCRRLGVAVAALRADGVDIMPADAAPGWHAPEPGWRWTDGEAAIACGGARRLEVTLVPIGRYWSEQAAAGDAAARDAAAGVARAAAA